MPDYQSSMDILGGALGQGGDPTAGSLAQTQPAVEAAKSNADDFDARMSILSQGAAGKLSDAASQPSAPIGPPSFEKGRAEGQQMSTGGALSLGAQTGASAGWGADVSGLKAASGLGATEGSGVENDAMSLGKILMGGARIAADKLGITSGKASQDYSTERDYEKGVREGATEAHPYATIGGEVGGSLLLPAGSASGGATLGQGMIRGAATGAGYGALYGASEGDGLEDRAKNAAKGAAIGGVAGGVAPAIVAGLGKAAGTAWDKTVSPILGVANPDAAAARQITGALTKDVNAPSSQVLSDAEIAAAKSSGQPVSVLDAGGEATRELARRSANVSPEARAALNDSTSSAFADQSTRASDFIRDLVGTSGDLPGVRERLQAAASAANKPAYNKAFSDPAGQSMWDDTLQQLAGAPAVQGAIRDATRTGANKAVAGGFQPIKNPFGFDDAGNMTLQTGATPNLQFWDTVKRNLDDQVSSLQRGGNKAEAADVSGLRRQLVDHLDGAVPSYQQARGTAASFFGASDALEAGEKFATSRVDNNSLRPVINRMNPAERKLFSEGFASSLASKVAATSDRQSIVGKIFQSPAARERVVMALGQDNANRLEAYMRVEGLMDKSRAAVQGNSTTARQLASMGASAGLGAGLSSYYGGDLSLKNIVTGALIGGVMRSAATKGLGAVDEGVARRVGEMLASGDPEKFRSGVRIMSNTPKLLDVLRNASPIAAHPVSAVTALSGAQ